MDAILLAAGKGTRMAPLTPALAKPLLPVAGRSLLHRMLDNLFGAGVQRVHVVTHHLAGEVESACRAHPSSARIRFVAQGEPRGTGHAVAAGAASLTGDAIVVMGDCLIDPATLRELVRGEGFLLAAARVADPQRYGARWMAPASCAWRRSRTPLPPTS